MTLLFIFKAYFLEQKFQHSPYRDVLNCKVPVGKDIETYISAHTP